jgi:hypothetical protein
VEKFDKGVNEMKKIKVLHYNWFYTVETGEEFSILTDSDADMLYHEARGQGDAHYVDATMADGSKERIFNLNKILFKVKE